MSIPVSDNLTEIGGVQFAVSRPHPFGLVLDGPSDGVNEDYLHEVLLSPENRESFLRLIEDEGLVVCKNVSTRASSYRTVRGKSSFGKLSQAEYFHHDGCSCPIKPRVVEIRLAYQEISRNVATAIARFPDVIRAMLIALPQRLQTVTEVSDWRRIAIDEIESGMNRREIEQGCGANRHESEFPPIQAWDKIQGRVTRLVRREMDAESCRAYFREVDKIAGAYDLPWEMGESRLMLNAHDDLAKTMQHRRAYQNPRIANQQNGSLVKRWTAEEA